MQHCGILLTLVMSSSLLEDKGLCSLCESLGLYQQVTGSLPAECPLLPQLTSLPLVCSV
jgi:hypothetical protein